MSEFIDFRDVRKVYKMGEVEIPALDGVSSVSYTHLDVYKIQLLDLPRHNPREHRLRPA